MFRWMQFAAAGVLSLGMLVSAGCEQRADSDGSDSAAASGDAASGNSTTGAASATNASSEESSLPAGLFVDRAPDGARSVGAVKADPTLTGDVVIVGRVGGRTVPFVPGAAMFVIADSKLLSCDQRAMDGCTTPWDYCCEPRDSLLANTATIQVVGADGRPLEANLAGEAGLAPLHTVTIAGKVALRDDAGTLVINAERIHVGKKPLQ